MNNPIKIVLLIELDLQRALDKLAFDIGFTRSQLCRKLLDGVMQNADGIARWKAAVLQTPTLNFGANGRRQGDNMSDEPKPIDDGGPMFPGQQMVKPGGLRNQTWEAGASIRTWGAFQLMAGLYASLNTDWHNPAVREAAAGVAMRGADALLAELAKGA